MGYVQEARENHVKKKVEEGKTLEICTPSQPALSLLTIGSSEETRVYSLAIVFVPFWIAEIVTA